MIRRTCSLWALLLAVVAIGFSDSVTQAQLWRNFVPGFARPESRSNKPAVDSGRFDSTQAVGAASDESFWRLHARAGKRPLANCGR